jgi:hypothetical protein
MNADSARKAGEPPQSPAFCAAGTDRHERERELPYPVEMIESIRVTSRFTRWRRAVLDGALTIVPPLLLLAFLVGYDDRVREQLTLRLAPERASHALVAAGSTMRSLAAVLAEAGRDQSIAHAPLLIFAMAAGALTLFMVRT